MAAKRPVLKIPLTPQERALEWLAIAALVINLLVIIFSWSNLQDKIPVHFNLAGKPDSYGDKIILLALPLFSFIQYFGLSILSRFPHTFNYPWRITTQNAARQYWLGRMLLTCLKTEFACFLAYITWQLTEIGQSKATDIGFLSVSIFIIIVFGSIGIYLRKAYQAR